MRSASAQNIAVIEGTSDDCRSAYDDDIHLRLSQEVEGEDDEAADDNRSGEEETAENSASAGLRRRWRESKKWTAQEDALLIEGIKLYGHCWLKISCLLKSRDPAQCMQRWKKSLRPDLVKGRWMPEEDTLLRSMVVPALEAGEIDWKEIAKKIVGRTSKQCRERWFNYLNPDLKQGGWTPDEDKLLLDLAVKYDRHWAQISREIHGRNENSVKTRFNHLTRVRERLSRQASHLRSSDDINMKSLSTTQNSSDDRDEILSPMKKPRVSGSTAPMMNIQYVLDAAESTEQSPPSYDGVDFGTSISTVPSAKADLQRSFSLDSVPNLPKPTPEKTPQLDPSASLSLNSSSSTAPANPILVMAQALLSQQYMLGQMSLMQILGSNGSNITNNSQNMLMVQQMMQLQRWQQMQILQLVQASSSSQSKDNANSSDTNIGSK